MVSFQSPNSRLAFFGIVDRTIREGEEFLWYGFDAVRAPIDSNAIPLVSNAGAASVARDSHPASNGILQDMKGVFSSMTGAMQSLSHFVSSAAAKPTASLASFPQVSRRVSSGAAACAPCCVAFRDVPASGISADAGGKAREAAGGDQYYGVVTELSDCALLLVCRTQSPSEPIHDLTLQAALRNFEDFLRFRFGELSMAFLKAGVHESLRTQPKAPSLSSSSSVPSVPFAAQCEPTGPASDMKTALDEICSRYFSATAAPPFSSEDTFGFLGSVSWFVPSKDLGLMLTQLLTSFETAAPHDSVVAPTLADVDRLQHVIPAGVSAGPAPSTTPALHTLPLPGSSSQPTPLQVSAALVYSGLVVASHIPHRHLRDVIRYANYLSVLRPDPSAVLHMSSHHVFLASGSGTSVSDGAAARTEKAVLSVVSAGDMLLLVLMEGLPLAPVGTQQFDPTLLGQMKEALFQWRDHGVFARIQAEVQERENLVGPSAQPTLFRELVASSRSAPKTSKTLSAANSPLVTPKWPPPLTVGAHNVLLHYVYLSPFHGVMVTSSSDRASLEAANATVLQKEVRQQFLRTVVSLTERVQESHKGSQRSSVAPDEIGVRLKSSAGDSEIGYWVVARVMDAAAAATVVSHAGRVLPMGFVCYHESVPQSAVDLAFELLYGACV